MCHSTMGSVTLYSLRRSRRSCRAALPSGSCSRETARTCCPGALMPTREKSPACLTLKPAALPWVLIWAGLLHGSQELLIR